MKIGVICPSEIAIRRFMPALMKTNFAFAGVAVNSPAERYGNDIPCNQTVLDMLNSETQKANVFIETYGGKIFNSYMEMICSDEIDAIYIPLPPGLHYKWAKLALENKKHVLVEKPSTLNLHETQTLIDIAQSNGLALHENYMFNFHHQLDVIEEIIRTKEIGDVRLYSVRFGFPIREKGDFRYVEALGGGAIMDAGGYCIKYATRLLGETIRPICAKLNHIDGYEVDMYGSGTFVNDLGEVVQIAFGMDNDYRCELEVWGSKGSLKTGRVLTAPVGFEPSLQISCNGVQEERKLQADDSFYKSIQHFEKCIENTDVRINTFFEMERQSRLLEEFIKIARNNI